MRTFEGIHDAADAVRRFIILNESSLPQHMADKLNPLTSVSVSPVDMTIQFAESVYANLGAKGVTKEARDLAAGVADVAQVNGYHGQMDGRAQGIRAALERGKREDGDPTPQAGLDGKPIAPPVAPTE